MDGSSWEILHCFQFWHSDTVIMENSGIISRLHLFSPLYYFVPHWVTTDAFSLSFPRQLTWCCGAPRRRDLPHWKVVSWVLWAEHGGWSRIFHPKHLRGFEYLQTKRLPRLGELPPTHRHVLCWIRSQTMQPRGVPGKWWRNLSAGQGLEELSMCGEKQHKGSREKDIKELSTVLEGGFPWCKVSGDNVGQENSCWFAYLSKSQQETSWCPCLFCPLLPAHRTFTETRLQRGARDLLRPHYLATHLLLGCYLGCSLLLGCYLLLDVTSY